MACPSQHAILLRFGVSRVKESPRRIGVAGFFTFAGARLIYIRLKNTLRMNFRLASGLLVLLLLATLLNVRAKDVGAKSVLNQKAPDFVVDKWLTPEPDRKGKFVLIDFWATWCAPCRKTIPRLNELQKQFPDKLVVVGVSDESERTVRVFKDPKIEYAIAIDRRKRMFNALRVEELPHVIVIDPQGIVRWEGFALADGDELTDKVMADIVAKYSK